MRIDSYIPTPPREYTLSFTRDEGWVIVMALKDAYSLHKNAQDRERWLEWANELDKLLRKGS